MEGGGDRTLKGLGPFLPQAVAILPTICVAAVAFFKGGGGRAVFSVLPWAGPALEADLNTSTISPPTPTLHSAWALSRRHLNRERGGSRSSPARLLSKLLVCGAGSRHPARPWPVTRQFPRGPREPAWHASPSAVGAGDQHLLGEMPQESATCQLHSVGGSGPASGSLCSSSLMTPEPLGPRAHQGGAKEIKLTRDRAEGVGRPMGTSPDHRESGIGNHSTLLPMTPLERPRCPSQMAGEPPGPEAGGGGGSRLHHATASLQTGCRSSKPHPGHAPSGNNDRTPVLLPPPPAHWDPFPPKGWPPRKAMSAQPSPDYRRHRCRHGADAGACRSPQRASWAASSQSLG